MKTYFSDLKYFKKNRPEEPVDYEFPKIGVGRWKVSGFIMNNHVILKGITTNNREKMKKYPYEKVYDKIRKNYQQWVEDKFCF